MEIKMKSINELEIFNPEEPRRVNNKWPAIIFAVRQIENVKRRIIKLIDSIITINGISIIVLVKRSSGWVKWVFI